MGESSPVARPTLWGRVNGRAVLLAAIILFVGGCLWALHVYYFVPRNASALRLVSLRELGQFQFDYAAGTLADVPDKFRDLDGKRVCLKGEIYSPNESNDVTHFQLVDPIYYSSSFHRPGVQERVFCTAPAGKSFKRGDGYHKVCGVLHVNVKRTAATNGLPAQIEELYHLDVESVEQS